jgi:hypothetical protein
MNDRVNEMPGKRKAKKKLSFQSKRKNARGEKGCVCETSLPACRVINEVVPATVPSGMGKWVPL